MDEDKLLNNEEEIEQEVSDINTIDTEEDIPTDDSTNEEEVQETIEDTIEDEMELPFYANSSNLDEIRDALLDLDYRLFLINNNLVVIGRLNGPDIEILTSVENEDGDKEYIFVKAPSTYNELLDTENLFYLSPEMTKEEIDEFDGKIADHEEIMDYLMNELGNKSAGEVTNIDVDDDELSQDDTEDIQDDLEDSLEDVDNESIIDDESEEDIDENDR